MGPEASRLKFVFLQEIPFGFVSAPSKTYRPHLWGCESCPLGQQFGTILGSIGDGLGGFKKASSMVLEGPEKS